MHVAEDAVQDNHLRNQPFQRRLAYGLAVGTMMQVYYMLLRIGRRPSAGLSQPFLPTQQKQGPDLSRVHDVPGLSEDRHVLVDTRRLGW